MIEFNCLSIFRSMFNRESYLGFVMSIFVQTPGAYAWMFAFVAPLILYMGLCSYIVAHAKDFKTIMTRLDDQIMFCHCTTENNKKKKLKKKKTKPIINLNLILFGIIKEAIETHLDLYKYDTDLN